jgi:hypothetical protein
MIAVAHWHHEELLGLGGLGSQIEPPNNRKRDACRPLLGKLNVRTCCCNFIWQLDCGRLKLSPIAIVLDFFAGLAFSSDSNHLKSLFWPLEMNANLDAFC